MTDPAAEAVVAVEADEPEAAEPSSGLKTVLLAGAALAILSIAAAVTSDGFIEADAATHFAYARYATHIPYYFVSVWARPLATGLFALPAALGGRVAVRLTSLACALGCGVVGWRLAILQGYRRPALAAIFTFGQPLLFLYSFSEMTELPFALALAAAFWAYRLECWPALAVLGSLLPLGRPEGFGFLLLVGVALVLHRRARWLFVLPVPLVVWSYAGWVIDWRKGHWWMWLIAQWPYANGSDYSPGSLFHFVMELPMLLSPAALPAMWIGAALALRGRWWSGDHRSRCQGLIAAIPLSMLVVHSLLFWGGRLSSNGELRYLLIAAPFWGLLSASGWEWIWMRLSLTRPTVWAGLAVVAVGIVNWRTRIVPVEMPADWQAAEQIVDWYRSGPLQRGYPTLVFAHPGIGYYLDGPAFDPSQSTPSTKLVVSADPPGCLLIWDESYSSKNADPRCDVPAAEALAAGWREIPTPGRFGPGWRIFLSSRSVPAQPG